MGRILLSGFPFPGIVYILENFRHTRCYIPDGRVPDVAVAEIRRPKVEVSAMVLACGVTRLFDFPSCTERRVEGKSQSRGSPHAKNVALISTLGRRISATATSGTLPSGMWHLVRLKFSKI